MTFRHPSLLALTSAAVDVLSGGRLEIGLGAGWESVEHEAFGIPFPSVAKRMEMLDEGIGVMKSLWTEDRANFNGRIYSLRDASGHPKPHQRPHPPIVIGGIGEKRLLRIVAKYANEWNAYGISQEQYHAKRAILERHCQAMGRDPSEIRHSVAGPLVVAESEAELHHRITTLSRLFPLPALFPPSDAPDVAYRPETLRARGWFAGQPDQLVEQIQALSRDGIHRVILQQLDLDDEESLGLVARSVLPHVT